MSVQQTPEGNFMVRWREGGRQSGRRFARESDARAFDAKLRQRKRESKAKALLRDVTPLKLRQQVYVIGGADRVKIGISNDPERRLAGLQTGSPTRLRILWVIACSDAISLEKALHLRYAANRTHGEWYDAAAVLADLEALAALGPFLMRAICALSDGEEAKAA